ncbi:MAG: 4Fe-4S binding protein [Planctomycetes bacterium]|nr:4Fe-4S binding protein [Planctomycetota bacterium]
MSHVESASPSTSPRVIDEGRYGRRRAWTLIGVHALFAAHIVHWQLAGRTLAPVELNEVMYTTELGIVTAGFLLMALTVVAAAVFGRFFCSWACHLLALQDLCGWLLGKVGIRPKPVRSRVLRVAPFVVLFYMFVWPQLVRVWHGEPLPTLRVQQPGEYWASFATDDLWRNLPGAWIAGLTFFVCGFAIVYMLGSRGFCAAACPYGAVFALADRLAPVRIALRGSCTDCGRCTAVCQ